MADITLTDAAQVRTAVSERYAAAAKGGGCCGSNPSSGCCDDAASADTSVGVRYYSAEEVAGLEQDVASFSLGCGNPIAFAKPQPGETVLDLEAAADWTASSQANSLGQPARSSALT